MKFSDLPIELQDQIHDLAICWWLRCYNRPDGTLVIQRKLSDGTPMIREGFDVTFLGPLDMPEPVTEEFEIIDNQLVQVTP